MQDLVYLAVLLAFFAVAALFVVACDKIIGSDEEALSGTAPAVGEPEPLPSEIAA